MNLTVLEDETLKITLSPEETVRYRLDTAFDAPAEQKPPLGSGDLSPSQRMALRTLLEDAGRRSGIDLINRRILVRIYPSALGGCEIYVSEAEQADLPEQTGEPDTLCRIQSAKNALMLRLALRRMGFTGQTELYLAPQGDECFLRVRGSYPPILGEFGQVLSMCGERAEPWLREHCTYLPEGE